MHMLDIQEPSSLRRPSVETKTYENLSRKAPSLLDLAPLLWVLLALIVGYSLAGARPIQEGYGYYMSLGIGLSALGLGYWSVGARRKAYLFIGIACFSFCYASYRKPLESPFSLFVTKEAKLHLYIERVFSGSKLYLSGIGRIATQVSYLEDLNGQKVYFRAKKRANPLYQDKPYLFLRGSVFEGKGVLRPFTKPKNDFERFLKEEGVGVILDCLRFETALQEPSSFVQACKIQASKFESTLSTGCDPAYAPIYTAMVLGRKGTLAPEAKRLFLLSGTMHVFAISGLHIGIVAAGLWALAKALRRGPWAPLWLCNGSVTLGARILGLGIVYLYVGITGFSASAERAFLMLCLGSLACMLRRQSHLVGTLAAAATCMLVWNPSYLDQLGFQLSFAAVGGIALYGLPLADLWLTSLQAWPQPLKCIGQWLLTSLAVSLGASLACAPLCMQAFKVFAYGGILINSLLLPLASMTVLLGVCSAGFGCIPGLGLLSQYLNKLASGVIAGMEEWIRLCLKLPFMYVQVEPLTKKVGILGLGLVLATMLSIQAKPSWSERPLAYALPVLSFLCFYVFCVCVFS